MSSNDWQGDNDSTNKSSNQELHGGHSGHSLFCSGLGLGGPSIVSHRLQAFAMKVPFAKRKWPRHVTDEIQDLNDIVILMCVCVCVY